MIALLLTAAASFTIGYLSGDRRAVRQCNEILDGHVSALIALLGDCAAEETRREDASYGAPTRPQIH